METPAEIAKKKRQKRRKDENSKKAETRSVWENHEYELWNSGKNALFTISKAGSSNMSQRKGRIIRINTHLYQCFGGCNSHAVFLLFVSSVASCKISWLSTTRFLLLCLSLTSRNLMPKKVQSFRSNLNKSCLDAEYKCKVLNRINRIWTRSNSNICTARTDIAHLRGNIGIRQCLIRNLHRRH